jgi:hypothetical protein
MNDASGTNRLLRFFDVTGRLAFELGIDDGAKRVEFVDLSHLKAGVYILHYVKEGRVVSQEKVVKI